MSRLDQIWYLIKQELYLARRSRYLLLSFIVMPLAMWAFQGGIQYFLVVFLEGEEAYTPYEGRTLYVMNNDLGNGSINYGELLIDNLTRVTRSNDSILYNVNIVIQPAQNMTLEQLQDMVKAEHLSPLLYVNATFTHKILTFNQTINDIPIVDLVYLPADHRFGRSVYQTLWSIVSQPPYQEVVVEKQTSFSSTIVTFKDEGGAKNTVLTGLIAYIVIILAVMAPAPYVSSSFSGEKEKRTLESLVSLPMKRIDILFSKLSAGMILIIIFALMNIVGIFSYQLIIDLATDQVGSNLLSSDLQLRFPELLSIFVMILLTSFTSIGIGVCIASLLTDTRTAEGVYTLSMLVPALIVGFSALYGNIPGIDSPMFFIPWTHSLLILQKSLFPQTYLSSTITGSIYLDIAFHVGYLLLFVMVSLLAAAKLFDRESLLA